MIAAAIVALYFWTFFSVIPDKNNTLNVNIPVVVLAGVTILVCSISYLWAPKKSIFPISILIFTLLASTTAALIVSTGGTSSIYIALWVLICLFAGVFGIWGILPVFIAVCVFVAMQYISRTLSIPSVVITLLSSLLPLGAGAIMWHDKSPKDEAESDGKSLKNLASELSEVTSKSEVVINAIGDGVIAIDSQGLIRLINPAAQSIIGWGKQDALALSYKSVLKLVNQKDEALDDSSDPIQQALNTNQQVRTNNLTLMTSSDKKVLVSLVVSPVGEVGSGVITVFRDVTKEKAEEREQAEFISTASHEMRTPVASIEGYLGLALNANTATIDDRARDFILKAHASAEHLGHLFQDLLDVSKSEDGRLSNNPKVINIVTFVHDVIQGLKQKAIEKGLQLTFKPMPDNATEKFIAPSYSVNLDNDHIREIVNNLVDNAIKYTPRGEVLVDVTGDEERIVLSVKDSGIGIPAEDMQHLFQKFYRVSNKNTNDIGGTGLGLYLCRRLAEKMGGRIWVESIYGHGSTFFVELPRVSNDEAVRLSEQEAIKNQQESLKIAENSQLGQTVVPQPQPVNTETIQLQNQPEQQPVIQQTEQPVVVNTVPRGQALTPEQIAAYVEKQRALAREQAKPQLSRPQSVSVPPRETV